VTSSVNTAINVQVFACQNHHSLTASLAGSKATDSTTHKQERKTYMSNLSTFQMSTGNEEQSDISVPEHSGHGISVKQTGGTTVVNQDGSLSQKGYASTAPTENPTFLNRFGNPSASFDPAGSVVIGGMTVSGKVAERVGYVSKDPAGNTQVNQSAVANDSAPDLPPVQELAPVGESVLSESEANAVNSALDGVDDLALGAITASALNSIVTNGDITQAVARYSQSTGVDPEIATAKIQGIVANFTESGSRYLESQVGLSRSEHSEFIQWASENSPQELKAAYQDAMNKNTWKSLGKLVGKYASSVEPSIEALNKANIPNKTSGVDGKTMIQLGNGSWVSLASATRAGLI
jgi:hypothetical protein